MVGIVLPLGRFRWIDRPAPRNSSGASLRRCPGTTETMQNWGLTPFLFAERTDNVPLARLLGFADQARGAAGQARPLADRPEPARSSGCHHDEWRRLRRRLV